MLATVAIGLLAVAAGALALARRRRARGAPLALAPARKAGVSHLAASVSELSDLGRHLRGSAAPRRRPGAMLGLR